MIFPMSHAYGTEKNTPTRGANGRCCIRSTSERNITMLCSMNSNLRMPWAEARTNPASKPGTR